MKQNISHIYKLLSNSKQVEELKHLSIIHDRLVRDRSRHLNKLHYVLREYYSVQEELFCEFGYKTHLKLIIEFSTFVKLEEAGSNKIIEFLKKNHYCRKTGTEKLIHRISSHKQFVAQEIITPYEIEAKCICAMLLNLEESIEAIEKAMNQITDAHKLGSVFKSLPGVGNVLACQLLALFGDNYERFENYNSVQCLYGTAPKNYQSGTSHKIMMRSACNLAARAILYRYAFASMNHSKWARNYYLRQREKGKTNSVAVRALSNKWVRIIYRMWKDQASYPEKHQICSDSGQAA